MTVTDCMIGSEPMSANAAAGIVELSNNKTNNENALAAVYTTLAEAATLCNAAEIEATTLHLPVEQKNFIGDATDSATLRFAETIASSIITRKAWRTIYRVPFNSKDKYMVHVAEPYDPSKSANDTSMTLYTKGAPDVLLNKCSSYLAATGESTPMTRLQLATIENVKDAWSRDAKRVILVARKNLPSKVKSIDPTTLEFENIIANHVSNGLEFVGMLAMIDPPRPEIPDVVHILRGAGIRVHMVTGDFKLTAQAIAVQCGIITSPLDAIDDISTLQDFESSWSTFRPGEKEMALSHITDTPKNSIVISGEDLKCLSELQWDVLCKYDEIVFARTTPEQKLRIVKELQARGETVASKSPIHGIETSLICSQ